MSHKKHINLMVILLSLVLAIGLVIGACGKSGSTGSSGSGSGIKAIYTGPAPDTFKSLLMESLAEAASEEGMTLDFGEECATINDQVEQIRQAVDSGYDAIICLPVDRATALQLQAAAGDVPIVYVNACPDEQYLKANKYIAVSSYENNAGEYQAEYVYEKLGKPNSLNIVILRGELTHNAAVARSVSVKHWFQDNGIQANVVFDDTANWSTDEAAEVINVFLETNQSFDAVFCNNDDMAIGACKALKAAGYDLTKVPVVGVDATEAGCQSILDGDMQFTVYQSATGQAAKAIEAVKELVNSGTADGIEGLSDDGLYIWVPFEKVDANNVKDYM